MVECWVEEDGVWKVYWGCVNKLFLLFRWVFEFVLDGWEVGKSWVFYEMVYGGRYEYLKIINVLM